MTESQSDFDPASNPSPEGLRRILRGVKTVAMVGVSTNPVRPSNYVGRYLALKGYRVIPVNPTVAEVLGQKSYPDLVSIGEPVDLVDVFRRPKTVVPIARQAVSIGAKALWLQLGIVNEEAAEIARLGGLDVVIDRCTHVEHRRLARQGKL